MRYEDWEAAVPAEICGDSLWKSITYRKALFLSDLAWDDCGQMLPDPRGRAIAHQLIRSAGSVAANIEEGYGRGIGRDRSHFLRIALGSARESRGWYYRARRLLSPSVLDHRLSILNECIALLVTELQRQK